MIGFFEIRNCYYYYTMKREYKQYDTGENIKKK